MLVRVRTSPSDSNLPLSVKPRNATCELSPLSKIYAIACDTGIQLKTGENGDDGAKERRCVQAALHSY